jgi:hypothetical protein
MKMDVDADDGVFSVKKHSSQGQVLVAACDTDILGKTFEDEELQIFVGEGFYGGETVGPDMLLKLMDVANIINLIGEKVVRLAVEQGLVDEDCIMNIGGVPHAQILRM